MHFVGLQLGWDMANNQNAPVSRDRKPSDREEKRLLKVVGQELASGFPNPQRKDCPDSAVLEGIACRKLRLADVEHWLDHLSSCSACFQQFTRLQTEAARRRRRTMASIAVAAVLLLAVTGWFWLSTHPRTPTDTEIVDLRSVSVLGGQAAGVEGQQTVVIYRWAKHLVVNLPARSEQGVSEIAILNEMGTEIFTTSATEQMERDIVYVEIDVDVSRFEPGRYVLAVRQPGLAEAHYRVQVPQ